MLKFKGGTLLVSIMYTAGIMYTLLVSIHIIHWNSYLQKPQQFFTRWVTLLTRNQRAFSHPKSNIYLIYITIRDNKDTRRVPKYYYMLFWTNKTFCQIWQMILLTRLWFPWTLTWIFYRVFYRKFMTEFKEMVDWRTGFKIVWFRRQVRRSCGPTLMLTSTREAMYTACWK